MELWDAYDATGKCTGALLVRGEPLPDGIYHLVAETVVQHSDGSILLMQRDRNKESYPGKWQIGAGGSAIAGEDAETAARRELLEETGLTAGEMIPLYRQLPKGHHGFYCCYLTRYDGPKDAVILQPGETIAYRWISTVALKKFAKSDDAIDTAYARLADWIASL